MANENLNIYFSKTLGIKGINHIYIYSPVTGRGKGLSLQGDSGFRGTNNPYIKTKVTTEQRKKLFSYKHWNKPIYIPFILDCHTSIQGAFKAAGVHYPAAVRKVGRFEDFSSYKDIANLDDAFRVSINDRNGAITTEISNLLLNYIKRNHKFTNRTGRLQASFKASREGDNVKIYSSAPYSDSVIAATGDNFFQKAILDNEDKIRKIIDRNMIQAISENEYRLRQVAEGLAQEILEAQFDQIFSG